MKTLIITASTRPVRVGDQISQIVARILSGRGATTEIVDLRELALPFLDEPQPAATGQYAHEHTVRWSRTVSDADAMVVVTPQYNAGYPAALKNAIDYRHAEWRGKPAAIISYGSRGGGQSYDQLQQVLWSVSLRLDQIGARVVIPPDAYRADGRLVDAEHTVGPYVEDIDAVAERLLSVRATSEGPAALKPPSSVLETADRLIAAFNAHDADAYAALFAEDGTYIDAVGHRQRGREIIAGVHRQAFAGPLAHEGLQETGREVRLLSSSVAHIEITWTTAHTTVGEAGSDKLSSQRCGVMALQLVYQPRPRTWVIAAGTNQDWTRKHPPQPMALQVCHLRDERLRATQLHRLSLVGGGTLMALRESGHSR